MTQVESRLKPPPIVCRDVCGFPGCAKTGQPATRLGHVRACPCPRCRGRRNRKNGLRAQGKALRELGLVDGRRAPSDEEFVSDNCFANEVKSGKQVGPLVNWWVRTEAQVLANRPDYGGKRLPARCVAMPDGFGGDGLVVVRLSTWVELVRPALEEFYGSAS